MKYVSTDKNGYHAHTYVQYTVYVIHLFVWSRDSDISFNILMKYKCHMNFK
jgi:hypothetical protein